MDDAELEAEAEPGEETRTKQLQALEFLPKAVVVRAVQVDESFRHTNALQLNHHNNTEGVTIVRPHRQRHLGIHTYIPGAKLSCFNKIYKV